MPKYLLRVKMTVDGLNGVFKEGATARREVVQRMVESLDGRLDPSTGPSATRTCTSSWNCRATLPPRPWVSS